jgi:hypothetical protein
LKVSGPTWTGPQYADKAPQRQHRPAPARPPTEYRECLRLEFRFTCVYCLSVETEVAPGARYGGFEIEHFRPIKRFGKLRCVYVNLLWACQECNRAKRESWPTDDEIARGQRFVDPCVEPLGAHLRLAADRVEALTAAGEFMITEINLNSACHRRRRSQRDRRAKAFALAEAKHQVLAAEVARDPTPTQLALLAEQHALLDELRLICLPAPWDAPIVCLCVQAQLRRKRLTRRQRQALREAVARQSS